MTNGKRHTYKMEPHCCPHGCGISEGKNSLTRRTFLKGMSAAAIGCMALTDLSWQVLSSEGIAQEHTLTRFPLKVKPVLVYSTPGPRQQTSWRSWGGIQTEEDAQKEVARIQEELESIHSNADFPVEFMPVARVKSGRDVPAINDIADTHVILIYAAGGWMDVFDALSETGKDMIFFWL